MRTQGGLTLLLAILACSAMWLPVFKASAQEIRPYLSFLALYPSEVAQGGEVILEYNLTKKILVGGKILTSPNTLKSVEASLVIPLQFPYNITRVVALDPDFNEIRNVTIEGSSVRVTAEAIAVLSIRAKIVVPLRTLQGDYQIAMRATGIEELPNGTLREFDHSRTATLSVRPWTPEVQLETYPKEFEPPASLSLKITILNVEDAWVIDEQTRELVKRGVRISDANLTIMSTLMSSPLSERIGSIEPGEIKLVSKSLPINPDVHAGRHTLMVLISYSYRGSSATVAITESIRVLKNAYLNLSVEGVPGEIQAGRRFNVTIHVRNDSPWQVSSATLLVSVNGFNQTVHLGSLEPYDRRVVTVRLTAPSPGTYDAVFVLEWMNPYPAEERNASEVVTLEVIPPPQLPLWQLVGVALAAGLVAAVINLVHRRRKGSDKH
ncbi:MAG TPA: hypothetical protein ENG69_05705 [Candidatus Korarchaeota archaeon]|nr:hypothetical protein [Candidatus Korarchaeota archaeon]